MRQSPEFSRIQEPNRFSNSLRIFEANYRELDRLLLFICDSRGGEVCFGGKTMSRGNRPLKRGRILDFATRKTALAIGIDRITVMLITRREPVKPSTLQKVITFFAKNGLSKKREQSSMKCFGKLTNLDFTTLR